MNDLETRLMGVRLSSYIGGDVISCPANGFVYDGRGKYMRQELTRENGRWVTIIVSN